MALRILLQAAPRAARAATVQAPRRMAASVNAAPDMFCFQCEQTEGGTGCTTVGVCGKTPETAGLQDALIHALKGVAYNADLARKAGAPEDEELNRFTMDSLFATLTNVNFDAARFEDDYVPKALSLRDRARTSYEAACKARGETPEPESTVPTATWTPVAGAMAPLDEGAVSVLARRAELGDEANAMQELIMYGIKGAAAYAHHAAVVGKEDPAVYADIQRIMALLGSNKPESKDFETLVGAALDVGRINLRVLELLDSGHTTRFGHPVPTPVSCKPRPGKAILVSGHDLHDLHQLLEDTKDLGIDVYTHGEMLPAHGYPELNKFPHLAGNYGGPWQLQKFEFAKFPGPILMTSNCIVEPRRSYAERIHSANAVGWPGVNHIATDEAGHKDFSGLIQQAMESTGFTDKEVGRYRDESVTVGFGHNTVASVADTVVGAIKGGDLKHIFLIGGCDGSEGERSYFRDLALATPKDSLILTVGCGKYRFNKHDLGTLGNTGLPRVLDMGQCNDSYSAVVTALTLAKAFDTDVNSLPLSFAISWFEQKAVAVFLTLLHLGIKNIHLGPNLPAFVTPRLAEILTTQFGLAPIGTVENDLKAFLGQAEATPAPAASV